jgi:ABC-type polysaccharide/polyol phosphate export permease
MIALAYLSGVFYTMQTMPESLKAIQPWLPTGQALIYLQQTAKHSDKALISLLCVLLWTGLFLIGSFLLRKSKITGKRGGR